MTMALSLVAASALTLAGCAAPGEGETVANGDEKNITIGVFNGWNDSVLPAELWRIVLEDAGYNVTLEYGDPAATFTGAAEGDYDLLTNVALPNTHANYWEQYGEELTDLGAWYDEAAITIAVNEDAPITSLEELADNAELFNNEIIGIEPGAGQIKITQEQTIPTYGLENMELVLSSTPGMLTELDKAIAAGENIAVTLWRPHWAYDEYPVRDLEDPEGTLGGLGALHLAGPVGFAERYPTLTERLSEFHMTDEQFTELANLMFNENDTEDYGPIIESWLEDNPEFAQSLEL